MPNLDLKQWPRSAPVTSIKKGRRMAHAQAHPLGTVSAGCGGSVLLGSWHPTSATGQQEWLQRAAGWQHLSWPFSPGGATMTSVVVLRDHCLRGPLGPTWEGNPSEPLGDFSTHSRMSRVQPALRISGLTSTVVGLIGNTQDNRSSSQLPGPTQNRRRARWSGWDEKLAAQGPCSSGGLLGVTLSACYRRLKGTCHHAVLRGSLAGERNRNTAVQEGQAQLLCGRYRPRCGQAGPPTAGGCERDWMQKRPLWVWGAAGGPGVGGSTREHAEEGRQV